MPLPTIPTHKAPEAPNLVRHDEVYKSPVVDTRKESYNTLAAFPAGQRMPCDLYIQKKGRDSASKSFQADLLPALGQLKLIRGFELIVTSPLNHNQVNEGTDSGGWESTGSALVYNCATPDMGDVFIADIGGGQGALLQITDVKRNSPYPEALMEISYSVKDNLTPELMEALRLRTVETWIFDRENMRNGVQALIRIEEVDVIRRLGRAYERLANIYFRDFYDDGFKTLVVPTFDGTPTYDPYMTRFVRGTIDSRTFSQVLHITELGVAHDVFSNQTTVFDAIMRMDIGMLYSISKKAAISPIESFRARPMMNSIFYSGIKQVVTFTDIPYSSNSFDRMPHGMIAFEKANVRQTDMDKIIPQLDMTSPYTAINRPIPLIHRVIHDECYIFSKAFYDGTTGMSVLENLLYQRLDTEVTDLQNLLEVAEDAVKWDNLERYYYYPIILALIKLAPGVL